MEIKKTEKAKLENYTKLFFQLGLVISLLIVHLSLEYKAIERTLEELAFVNHQSELIEEIPITERLELLQPPPPPAAAPESHPVPFVGLSRPRPACRWTRARLQESGQNTRLQMTPAPARSARCVAGFLIVAADTRRVPSQNSPGSS